MIWNSFFLPYNNGYFVGYPFIPPNCDKPPTLYAVLNSIVNGKVENEEDYSKIKDLAKLGRTTIFNFDYPLSQNVSRETFETTLLNHYMMRRINFETVTAFQIALNSKLNEIMPLYNKMFDALESWSIFEDGEVTTRTANTKGTNQSISNTETTSNTNTTSDRRESNTPQSQLNNVRDGSYVTNYNYDTNTGNDSGTSKGTTTGSDTSDTTETIKRSPSDKMSIYRNIQEVQSIYTMIFKDLDVLFYGLL